MGMRESVGKVILRAITLGGALIAISWVVVKIHID